MAGKTQTKPFGIADKIGYMFGDFGNDFTFILSSMMLMKFYSDVMDVSVGLVGLMMTLARVVDAFTDVAMGQIADRSRPTAKGKFAPWLRRVCGPVAVASFLMYASWFQNMPMAFKIFWMFFTYLLWGSVCYTGINIPYGSMASAISGNPEDRAQLSTWRTIGATLAGTVIGVVLPLVVYYTDADGNKVLDGGRMSLAAGLCSIGAVICYMLCYTLTTERVKLEQKTEKFNLGQLLASLIKNRALIGIVVASICLLLSQLTLSSMVQYVFPNFFKNTAAQSMTGVINMVVVLVCSAFAVPLTSKFGRKEVAVVSSIWGAVCLILAFILPFVRANVWVFVGFYSVAYVGIAIFTLICWAMITDVIDDTEVKSGERSDGTIYAVYSFARKLGQAASSSLSGGLLTLIGYTKATAFDDSVTTGIYNITCLAPALGFILLAIVLMFLYPLGKSRVESNAKILAGKAEKKAKR